MATILLIASQIQNVLNSQICFQIYRVKTSYTYIESLHENI